MAPKAAAKAAPPRVAQVSVLEQIFPIWSEVVDKETAGAREAHLLIPVEILTKECTQL